MEKQIEFLIKLRDSSQMIADAANEYLETFAPTETKPSNQAATVAETTFNSLRFQPQQGARLGEYETAHKTDNPQDKWQQAYNILKDSNATIRDRYHPEGYQHGYWIYNEDRIYRQKLKPKP